MKLKDFAKVISDIAVVNPDLEVVYSQDDEGNCFDTVKYSPQIGYWENGNWTPYDNKKLPNAICVN